MNYEIINRRKKEMGITNSQLAELAGITLSTLDKITSGANKNPKLDTLQAIASVIGCSLDDFCDVPRNISPEALSIALAYDKTDAWGKQIVDAVVDAVVAVESARCSTAPQAPSAGDLVPAADPRERKKSV